MTKNNPPVIRHLLNFWTMVDYPTAKKQWSIERKYAAAKEAGFDGVTTNANEEHRKLADKFGLMIVGFFSAGKVSEFGKLIRQNVDAGATSINVQLADHDTPVEQSIKLAIKLIEEGEKLGAKCSVEVHRDTCTETPEKTYAIAAGYKKATGKLLRLTWDFSHLSVVKHLGPPYWERLLVEPKLVQNAEQFHLRPFNGHHCQIPVTNGHGKFSLEFQQWLPFLEKTFEMWVAGKQDGRELYAVPEMGPVPGGYNFEQLPNSWEDAKVLRTVIDKTWKKVLAAKQSK